STAAALGLDTTDASTVGHLVTPYVYNFSLNVQHEFPWNTVLEVGYVGTYGRKLQRIVDLGQPSQAAITAFDNTCVDFVNGVTNPSGIPLGPLCTGVPRNFNSIGNAFPQLPGQNNNAAIMSPLAPQTPFYLQQLQTTARSQYHSLQAQFTQRNWH